MRATIQSMKSSRLRRLKRRMSKIIILAVKALFRFIIITIRTTVSPKGQRGTCYLQERRTRTISTYSCHSLKNLSKITPSSKSRRISPSEMTTGWSKGPVQKKGKIFLKLLCIKYPRKTTS
jgi:hypothetical protein